MLEAERDDWLARVARDWRTAKLGRVDHALCVFAEKLTRDPGGMRELDVDVLRQLGLDDVRIHDAIQVVAYFNYVNRVADAVHIDLEPEMEPYPEPGAP